MKLRDEYVATLEAENDELREKVRGEGRIMREPHANDATSPPDAGVTDDRCVKQRGEVNQTCLIPLRTPPHLFENPKSIVTENTSDRTSQTERTCKTCGLTKITVHGKAGQSWREWRVRGGVEQFCSKVTPECTGQGKAET